MTGAGEESNMVGILHKIQNGCYEDNTIMTTELWVPKPDPNVWDKFKKWLKNVLKTD